MNDSISENLKEQKAGLVVEPSQSGNGEQFHEEMSERLEQTAREVYSLIGLTPEQEAARSWERAQEIVREFKPVPWFIWRLSNYVLGKSGAINSVQEGLVFGLRRLLFAAATDERLGAGRKVNQPKEALKILEPDVIAAVAVIHAICKRLAKHDHQRIWRPILDDALLRAEIGFVVGSLNEQFGAGRGMLAGFTGRSGLATLIASGTLEQAREALEMLAIGTPVKQVGTNIYECEPLQVGAFILSVSGCGRDAAYGTAAYSSERQSPQDEFQKHWLSAFAICEHVRTNTIEEIPNDAWEDMNFKTDEQREMLTQEVKGAIRRGHDWGWIL